MQKARSVARRAIYAAQGKAAEWAKADRASLALWSPVAIGVGAGVYFGLGTEPMPWLGPVAMLVSAGAALVYPRLRALFIAVALLAAGFAAADFRTARVAAPILERELGIELVTGRLVAVEESESRRRLNIALTAIDGVDADELPARARITWRGDGFDVKPGDVVSLRAGLSPPPPPAAPGTFDFARQLYFQRIGAVGFAVTAPKALEVGDPDFRQRWAQRIETMRLGLARRIVEKAQGEGGAIVAAVVTGKREAIPEDARNALRDAGLAHLLAISGLHMGLATGLVFFIVRFGLALIEPVALRFPIKKWAAVAALLAGAFYLILSGGGWSARRAFIMTAIMLIAILFDRRALSLRNVAIAATVILLATPEAVFHPGFQMSFAAVTGLIAIYEYWTNHRDPNRTFTAAAKAKRYVIGLGVTDTVAALATAPFALYHFNRVALFSLPANMAAMPLMGFWVMPAAVLALLLMPLGLDGFAWRISAWGMEVIVNIAKTVSNLPGAVSVTPQWPLSALLALVFGGLWLCLSRAPWRLAGFAAIPLSVLLVMSVERPQLFVAASGLNAGLILPESNELIVFSTRRDKFSAGVWKEAAGFDPDIAASAPMKDRGACDDSGCVITYPGRQAKIISMLTDAQALGEDCARAELVVAFFPVSNADWRACKATLIDRRSIWRRGAHAVRLDGKDIHISTVNAHRGRRPWTLN